MCGRLRCCLVQDLDQGSVLKDAIEGNAGHDKVESTRGARLRCHNTRRSSHIKNRPAAINGVALSLCSVNLSSQQLLYKATCNCASAAESGKEPTMASYRVLPRARC